MVFQPFRRIMSNVIQTENRPAMPIKIDEMTVSASGGVYSDISFIVAGVIESRKAGKQL